MSKVNPVKSHLLVVSAPRQMSSLGHGRSNTDAEHPIYMSRRPFI